MIGSHLVKRFPIDDVVTHLPEGWKPFAYDTKNATVICRKWVRSEKEEK